MSTIFRTPKYLLPGVIVVGIILLTNVSSLAQSNPRLPSPTTHVNDFAGIIDAETKNRLETLLQTVKEKTKVDFYVATVETTGSQDISDFSSQLALDWSIGARTSAGKSLLLVVSAESKSSFTRFSKLVQPNLPEGVLGDMTQRMRAPLAAGRFGEAIDVGVQFFVNALAQKSGINLQLLEKPVAAAESEAVAVSSPQPGPTTNEPEKTRPRVVNEVPKPPSTETPEPTKAENPPAKTAAANKKPTEPVDEEAEAEEVELTLTLPLTKRAVALKEFLETYPNSKAKTRATELLISTHAGLGDQQLKKGDSAGGVAQLLLAIEESDVSISDQLFSGVIAQIPMNLHLRGEKAAAFKAAQSVEAKFATNPKRLLSVASFYLGIERGDEAVRIAEQAVKLNPDLAEAHRVLAFGLHMSLRLDEATAEYRRALDLDPTSKGARGSLADLDRAGDKPDEALSLYEEQLKADPKDRPARAGKVISLFELGRKDDANAALDAAILEDPGNLPLLAGTAYWFAAREEYERAFQLARKATVLEPRYTWAQIALVRSLLGLKRPLDAERAIRFARQYGKFPTLNYELANVLATMGLYDEAAEVLRESFVIKDGQIQTQLGGRWTVREADFIELLAPERRASIYQKKAADSAANAKMLKDLLSFNSAVDQPALGEKLNEELAARTAREFASGTDKMRAFRQLYGASRLIRNRIGLETALELIEDAKKASEAALDSPVVTMAVQADEFRELRATSMASGKIPDVAEAPRAVLSKILRGRLEELTGWAFFNQDKPAAAVDHLKKAVDILPAGTPAWRSALWHLGVALEESGNNAEGLANYIKSYNAGEPNPVRRSVIEHLYRKIHGSLSGLDKELGGVSVSNTPTSAARSAFNDGVASKPAATSEKTPTSETTVDTSQPVLAPTTNVPTPEPTPVPTPEGSLPPTAPRTETSSTTNRLPTQEEALKASSRARSTVRITGRVLDADRVGLANVVLVLISPSGSVLASTTDTEGYYSFTVTPSQKTYRIIPSKDGYTFAPVDRAFVGLSEDQKEVEFVAARNP